MIQDGYICETAATFGDISARNTLEDKLKGLKIGSDDYLTKPFHLSELNARVKSLLRRRQFGGHTEISVSGDSGGTAHPQRFRKWARRAGKSS